MKKTEGQVACGKHFLSYTGISHKGQVRKINEDNFLIMPEFQLFCVADGMGGYEKGEVASRITVEAIGEYVENLSEKSGETYRPGTVPAFLNQPWVEEAIRYANAQVVAEAAGTQMGSTIVVGHFTENGMEVGHVGDSRAYRWRNGELLQLTEDHSLVYSLYKMGHITREQMHNHPQKNVVTQALGPDSQITPAVTKTAVLTGDIFLFCSDGLSGMVADKEICHILETEANISTASDKLISAANQAGGLDNITVILVAVR